MKTPARAPQHRYSRLQVKASDRAYHVSRVLRAVVVLDELLTTMRWLQPGTYEIAPGVVSKAKSICADAIIYARQQEEGYRL